MQPNPDLFRHPEPAPPLTYNPPMDDLEIIHQDEHILVLNKPGGLLTVPGKYAGNYDCLESRARKQFQTLRVVHRLDMETSGVIIMALTPQAQRHLGRQFEKRRTQKIYHAIVEGEMPQDAGDVDLPLRCDWPNRPKQMVCMEEGRPSQTSWKVLERADGNTRLELTPVTGRSHQLRVHLMALGHPIVGDVFYSNQPEKAPRMMLHASRLQLRHPDGGAELTFESPCPF